MAAYIQHFIEHGGQIAALFSVLALWLGFSALGAVGGGVHRVREFDPLVGWAWLSLLFTLAGVFLKVPFSTLAVIAGVLAIAAGIWVWRRHGGVVPESFLKILILAVPLLVLVSAMRASQWDEFSDWLIIPRYLLATDAFPSQDNPFPNAVFTGYPYSWHFVTYLASRLAGYLLENAGALTNVLLLLMFGLVIVRLIAKGLDREDLASSPGWSLVALGGLAATLVNPTFAQKVVLTSYAETSSAVATAAAVVLGWLIVEALIDARRDEARQLALQMGAILALLINLKQATMVLVVLSVLATTFVVVRDRRVPVLGFVKLLPMIVLPALIIYLAWRYHVSAELQARELSLRPFDQWNIALIPQIIGNMLVVLAKKGYYLFLIAVAVGFGIRGFFRSATPLDRFAAIAAMVVLGYNAFLLLAYVASFGKFDALRVASYWRYNMHLGLVVAAFTGYAAAILWRQRIADKWTWHRLGWLPILLMIVAPFVFAKKLRFDQAPMTVHYRDIGAEMSGLVSPGDGYFIADPAGSGESAVIMSFEIGPKAKRQGFVSAFFADRLKQVKNATDRANTNVMVVFSVIDGMGKVLGQDLKRGQTYLLRRQNLGPWQVVKTWPQRGKN